MHLQERSRGHEALPSTSCDIMYLKSLKLLQPMVKEMHLQENTSFDLDPKVIVTQNVAQCPLHHVTYAVTASNGLGGDAITRKYIL